MIQQQSADPLQLVEAVRSVAAGDSLLAPTVTRRLIEHFVSSHAPREQPPEGVNELTPREVEVFKLVARGLSNTEIAGELVVSESTVKTTRGAHPAQTRAFMRAQVRGLLRRPGGVLGRS